MLLLSTLLRGHHAGQFCWIQIPAVNAFEWHPFTISSSPYSSLGEGGSVCFMWFFILYLWHSSYIVHTFIRHVPLCLSLYFSAFLRMSIFEDSFILSYFSDQNICSSAMLKWRREIVILFRYVWTFHLTISTFVVSSNVNNNRSFLEENIVFHPFKSSSYQICFSLHTLRTSHLTTHHITVLSPWSPDHGPIDWANSHRASAGDTFFSFGC